MGIQNRDLDSHSLFDDFFFFFLGEGEILKLLSKRASISVWIFKNLDPPPILILLHWHQKFYKLFISKDNKNISWQERKQLMSVCFCISLKPVLKFQWVQYGVPCWEGTFSKMFALRTWNKKKRDVEQNSTNPLCISPLLDLTLLIICSRQLTLKAIGGFQLQVQLFVHLFLAL